MKIGLTFAWALALIHINIHMYVYHVNLRSNLLPLECTYSSSGTPMYVSVGGKATDRALDVTDSMPCT